MKPSEGFVLSGRPPKGRFDWEARWLKWPDLWLPSDEGAAHALLREAWCRSLTERVDVACGGGVGRTGTALACIAVLDGLPPSGAIDFVRKEYHPRAVETPWQKRYVSKFDDALRNARSARHATLRTSDTGPRPTLAIVAALAALVFVGVCWARNRGPNYTGT